MISNLFSILPFVVIALSALLTVHANPDVDNFILCLNNKTFMSHPISHAIYTTNNPTYYSVLQAYIKNQRFLKPNTPKPEVIVAAMHASHVQATVVCAKSNGLQIRIRSGGHDYEGLSYISHVPFVILDMFNLRTINIDIENQVASLQSGATLGELYYAIANKSNIHAFPSGVCFTVGSGGHFSGGGYGNLMRKFGLSVDNIIDAEIVDVQGRILNRKSMGEDLFWAIRGGGGVSFGVILSWTIRLVHVPETVTTFSVNKTLEEGATNVFYKWQLVAPVIDRELFIRAKLNVTNGTWEGNKTVLISFIGMYLGQCNELVPLLNEKFPELGFQKTDCQEMSWVQSTLVWWNLPKDSPLTVLTNRDGAATFSFKRKSDYVTKVIEKEELEKIWRLMIKVGSLMSMHWNPFGARMNEISEKATPYPHRAGILFLLEYSIDWTINNENEGLNQVSLLNEMYESMVEFVSKGPRETYLNYRDLDIGSNPSNETDFTKALVYGIKYFKGNFLRLTKVKGRVDPSNFFKNEQSIPPMMYI